MGAETPGPGGLGPEGTGITPEAANLITRWFYVFRGGRGDLIKTIW